MMMMMKRKKIISTLAMTSKMYVNIDTLTNNFFSTVLYAFLYDG